jgi:hypothetical protein
MYNTNNKNGWGGVYREFRHYRWIRYESVVAIVADYERM